MKTWKKTASKVAEPAQIQPKSQFLFHKNLPPRDFSIMTLIDGKINFQKKSFTIFNIQSECNNFNQWEKECHVIYNPPYDYKFQLKTTFMSRKSIAAKLGNSKLVGQTWGKFTVAANFSMTFSLTLDSC